MQAGSQRKKRGRGGVNRFISITLRVFFITLFIVIVGYLGLAGYIATHKEEIKTSITEKVNNEISGKLTIGALEPVILKGFPHVSVALNNVTLQDSMYTAHKNLLLDAGRVTIALNTIALIQGKTIIKKITVKDAAVNFFTDKSGYKNTTLFKKRDIPGGDKAKTAYPELRKLILDNVSITARNEELGKLHQFKIGRLATGINYTNQGWDANVRYDAYAENMMFNVQKGSFIKDKSIKGKFEIDYNASTGIINFSENELQIGDNEFLIAAQFNTKTDAIPYILTIANKKITWDCAAELLPQNIANKLVVYTIQKPFAVTATIKGKLKERGNPYINVKAEVRNNTLDTPGGIVDNCNFTGVYNNNFKDGGGYTDENSTITFHNFKGSYTGMPFSMKRAEVLNLKEPIITGDFTSKFEMEKLSSLVDADLLNFTRGTANVQLDFKADIENFELAKPLVSGTISVKDADISYMPRNLDFKDVSLKMDFKKDDLYISDFSLKGGTSTIHMQGSIKNFLNIYYTAPEKMVLQWEVSSPSIHLNEFMGFIGKRKNTVSSKKSNRKGNFTEEVNSIFENSSVAMQLNVDELYYKRFYATGVKAYVTLTEQGIAAKKGALNHSDGHITFDGTLNQVNGKNNYTLTTNIDDVNIKKFFNTFNNFSMQVLKSDNLEGKLRAKVNVEGSITKQGQLVPNTLAGTASFSLNDAALLNFEPVTKIAKYAFPFRDVNNITFTALNGTFGINGDLITIYPMKISSSMLNMDVEGVYSFAEGTEIYIAVPLRNPKRDEDITDKDELAKRRHRGIVINLIAMDDEDGKVKIKLGKKKD